MQTNTRPGPGRPRDRADVDFNATLPGTRRPAGRGRHADYSHELSDEETEAVTRWLVRIVPLIFGALLGGLAENLAIGLAGALVVSLSFDLSMEKHSIILGLYRRLRRA